MQNKMKMNSRKGSARLFAAAGVSLTFFANAFGVTAFVSNEKDNTISVIDVDKMEVVETIEVGQRPRGIILNRDNSRLYICASDDDTVQIMDVAGRKVIGELPSGADPEQFALHPNDRHLYVANEDDNIATVIDVETARILAQIDVGVEPEGMAVSPDGKVAVNTSETTNMVHWLDTVKFELFDNTLVDQRPRHAEFDKTGKQLWVSAEIGGTVAVIDVATRKVEKTLRFEIRGVHRDRVQPVGVKLGRDGRYAFVALGPANHVAVVNRDDYSIEKYILVGRRVWHLAFTPDESRLLTTNGVSGDVTVIDVASLKAVKSIKVGRYPWGVAITP